MKVDGERPWNVFKQWLMVRWHRYLAEGGQELACWQQTGGGGSGKDRPQGALRCACPGKRRDSEDMQKERWHGGSNVRGQLILQQFIEGILDKDCICQNWSRSCNCQSLQAVRRPDHFKCCEPARSELQQSCPTSIRIKVCKPWL